MIELRCSLSYREDVIPTRHHWISGNVDPRGRVKAVLVYFLQFLVTITQSPTLFFRSEIQSALGSSAGDGIL